MGGFWTVPAQFAAVFLSVWYFGNWMLLCLRACSALDAFLQPALGGHSQMSLVLKGSYIWNERFPGDFFFLVCHLTCHLQAAPGSAAVCGIGWNAMIQWWTLPWEGKLLHFIQTIVPRPAAGLSGVLEMCCAGLSQHILCSLWTVHPAGADLCQLWGKFRGAFPSL